MSDQKAIVFAILEFLGDSRKVLQDFQDYFSKSRFDTREVYTVLDLMVKSGVVDRYIVSNPEYYVVVPPAIYQLHKE